MFCFDEMEIKAAATYRPEVDRIDGFEDFGELGGRNKQYASKALAFEVHGMLDKWKQPLRYLLANSSTPPTVLHELTLETLNKLSNGGLEVRVLVSDMGSTNLSLLKSKLNVTIEKPYFFRNDKKS